MTHSQTMVPLPSGGSVPLNECHVYSEMTLHKIVESAAAVVNWENYTLTMERGMRLRHRARRPAQREGSPASDHADRLRQRIADHGLRDRNGELTLELLIAEARAAYAEETAEIEHETREKEKA